MATEPCHQLLGQLSDYVEGALDPELCRALEAHMAGCDNCRTVVDTLSETVHLYRALPPATVSAALSARLRTALGLAAEAPPATDNATTDNANTDNFTP